MNFSNQIFSYTLAGTDINVDQLVPVLAQYGINDVTVRRGPINEISVRLENPTPQQLQGIQEVLRPLETIDNMVSQSAFPAAMERRLTPRSNLVNNSKIRELPSPRTPSAPNLGQISPPSNVQFMIPSFRFDQ